MIATYSTYETKKCRRKILVFSRDPGERVEFRDSPRKINLGFLDFLSNMKYADKFFCPESTEGGSKKQKRRRGNAAAS